MSSITSTRRSLRNSGEWRAGGALPNQAEPDTLFRYPARAQVFPEVCRETYRSVWRDRWGSLC